MHSILLTIVLALAPQPALPDWWVNQWEAPYDEPVLFYDECDAVTITRISYHEESNEYDEEYDDSSYTYPFPKEYTAIVFFKNGKRIAQRIDCFANIQINVVDGEFLFTWNEYHYHMVVKAKTVDYLTILDDESVYDYWCSIPFGLDFACQRKLTGYTWFLLWNDCPPVKDGQV